MAKKRKLHSQKHGTDEATPFMEGTSENTMKVQKEETLVTENINSEIDTQEANQVAISSSQPIGDYLKSAREANGLTLQHIAHVTKISLKNLNYLEEGALESLPDKIYVFGYVKNYTKVLSIDNSQALRLLEAEYERLAPPQFSAPEPEVPKNVVTTVDSLSNSEKQNYIIMGLIALVVVVIGSVFMFSSEDEEEPKQEVVEAKIENKVEVAETKQPIMPQSLSSQTPLQKEIENVKEQQEQEPTVVDTPPSPPVEKKVETVEVKKPEKTEEKKTETTEVKREEEKKEKVKDDKKLANRKFYKMSVPLYSALEPNEGESYSDLVPADIDGKHSDALQNIFVYAKGGSCWVTYQTEDSRIRQRYLKDGSFTFVRGKEIRMAIGNTGSARVFLNKEPIKLLTTTGVKNLVIPQENSKNYKMPLFVYNKEKNSFLTSAEYIKKLDEQSSSEEN